MLCDLQITQRKEKIYIQYICWFVKGDSEVCGGSFFKLSLLKKKKKKCQISLKSLFHRVFQISEPNTALSNVGGRRLHVQGRIMGLPNGYHPFFLMQSSLQLTPKKRKGWNVYSLFLAKSQKGKRRSSGIEGFGNMIHSLLNGNGGNTLLCNGLISVLNLCGWIYCIYPTRLCQYLMKSPQYLKYLNDWKFVFNSIATLGDFNVS